MWCPYVLGTEFRKIQTLAGSPQLATAEGDDFVSVAEPILEVVESSDWVIRKPGAVRKLR